ncbi:MAG: hypothetical protein EBS05_00230 [Proteobacteria bacterium]|nr:hypothetical protein [Pseudomonadota bacterium]
MKLGPLCEIILYVRDMAAQVSFYRDVLALPVQFPSNLTNYSAEHWVTFDTGGCTLALHGGGTGQFGDDAPKFVFRVTDLDAARSELLAKGVRLGPKRFPAPGVNVCDGCDPEGNWFSLEALEAAAPAAHH